ncbi:MAG: hypothetical protein L6265_10500 [Thermoplasmatales archaeon]|nr:hypothetical protein [Candidatus Methanoperedenaceae archaeon]MCG2827006.1 hypothetical protein [Thermoplasmatales archaeon]
MKKYCKKCKKEVETDNLFCPFCKSLTYPKEQKIPPHSFDLAKRAEKRSAGKTRVNTGEDVICPNCGAEMQWRKGRYGAYCKCLNCGRTRSARHVWGYSRKMSAFDKFDDALDTVLNPFRWGKKSSGCFITTAVMTSLGRTEDDCYELKILRKFRDEYILKTDYGKKLIKEYYQISPKIVEKIDTETDSEKIYSGLLNDFITPSIKYIGSGENKKAMNKYIKMVMYLKQKYN